MTITSSDFRVFNCYLFIKWLSSIVVRSIFTKITIIHEERLPLYGPVIVVGNHNNQFLDAALLIYAIPRQISFIIAAKTLKRKLIGTLASLAGCISVYRPEDLKYSGVGTITWENDSTVLVGKDTKFRVDLSIGDKIVFGPHRIPVRDIVSDTELILESPVPQTCSDKQHGEPFLIVPKVDQSEAYQAVSASLRYGNAIVIFPEGGSHDRTNLLPLKPGVALMAFNSLLDGAEDVVIVPVGLISNNLRNDQSYATIYYGNAITITKEDIEEFQVDRRATVSKILGQIETGLKHCMITAPNIRIKEWIDLCASLYPPERSLIPTSIAFELRQIISTIFWKHEDSPETQQLIEHLSGYQKRLDNSFLRDGEVWLLKQSLHSAILLLIENTVRLGCYVLMGLSFAPLWFPLYAISKVLAERHRIKALNNSSVKLDASDVVASYKMLVLIVIVPLFNFCYGFLLGLWLYVELKKILMVTLACMVTLPIFYYINLKYARKIPRLLRQLHVVPLIVIGKINTWRETERELITMRTELQLLVREFVHKMGPKVSETFLDDLGAVIPRVLVDADTSRLKRIKDHWMPIFVRDFSEIREEIL